MGCMPKRGIVESWQLSEKMNGLEKTSPIEKLSKHYVWIIGS